MYFFISKSKSSCIVTLSSLQIISKVSYRGLVLPLSNSPIVFFACPVLKPNSSCEIGLFVSGFITFPAAQSLLTLS